MKQDCSIILAFPQLKYFLSFLLRYTLINEKYQRKIQLQFNPWVKHPTTIHEHRNRWTMKHQYITYLLTP